MTETLTVMRTPSLVAAILNADKQLLLLLVYMPRIPDHSITNKYIHTHINMSITYSILQTNKIRLISRSNFNPEVILITSLSE